MKSFLKRSLILLSFPMVFSSCATLNQLGLGISDLEAITGLKDALSQGMFRSFEAFADPNSTANPLLKFALPKDAQNIQKTLNDLGLGGTLDKATAKFTNAMSGAVQATKPILINSIKKLTIKDALNILVTDNTHAATDYFKSTNKTELLLALRPVVDSTVKVEKADVDWSKITAVYNVLPFKKEPLEKDLTDFISGRIVDGMCMVMAEEEAKIRTQFAFRKTDMMKKAFSYAEQQLKLKSMTGQ